MHLEQVVSEVTDGAMQPAEKQSLVRAALALTAAVEDFAGGLDRDSSSLRKRAYPFLLQN